MAQTYEVKAGDNLSTIAQRYGVPISAISGYRSGNPNLIYPGEKLTIGDSQGGSLGGTLPPEQPKTLPQTPSDNLSIFRNLLKTVSEKAGQQATATGVSEAGFDPSKMSGGTLSGIVKFIQGQKTQGIADIYKQTTDMLDSQQKQAQEQLQMLISANAIGDLTDSALAKLSAASGADYEMLDSIRKQQKIKKAKPVRWDKITKGGKEYMVGYDEMGNIIVENPTGADEGGGSMTEAERKRMAVKDMDAVIQGVRGKDGFISPDDWKIALDSWMKEGYSAKDFELIFEQYKNPDNLDYPD